MLPKEFKKLYLLFHKKDRFKILLLFIMMIIAAVLEVAGIGVIPAFVAVVANPDKLLQNPSLGEYLSALNITTPRSLMITGGIVLMVVFIIKNLYLILYQYVKTKFVFNRRYYFNNKMMTAYMRAPYTFHLQRNTAELLRNITHEIFLLIQSVLIPGLELMKSLIMSLAIVIFLLSIEPLITLIAIFMLGGVSIIFLAKTSKKIKLCGSQEQYYRKEMIKAINQGLGGIKHIRVMNREEYFIKAFSRTAHSSSKLLALQSFIANIPRPIVETIAIFMIILVAMVMVWQQREISTIIPIITLFSVAAVRLLPAIQQITGGLTRIKYAIVAVNPLYDDLQELSKASRLDSNNKGNTLHSYLTYTHSIDLKEISFGYPNSELQAIKNLSMSIEHGKSIAIVGHSGAGKTTLVDIILGLLEPQAGDITVDGKSIYDNLAGWQQSIGYVPQYIYLSDDQLRRNIAFGLSDDEIDHEKLIESVELAQLKDLIKQLPEGLNTVIGESGARLSGGQRQRVGIARALYHRPKLLIMDEATSSLDNLTEQQIVEAIESLKGDRTVIIVAHRLTTVMNCDVLFFMNDGTVTDSGTYEALLKNNPSFREMALK